MGILWTVRNIYFFFTADLSKREGLEHQLEVEEMDDETYTGFIIYKPWGDFTKKPMMTC